MLIQIDDIAAHKKYSIKIEIGIENCCAYSWNSQIDY